MQNNKTALPQTNTPTLRFPEFKEGWLNKKYNEIYSFYSTNSFSRDNLNYEEGEVRNIHYGDIHTKFSTLFDLNKELVPFINKEVNISRIKEENYVKEGDLLIADASEDYSDIGKTVEVVNINNEKVLSGLHTFHARPNKYEMASGFAGYMLQSWRVRKQVMKIAQGTKVLGLATSRLGNIGLNIPEFEEQKKIATFLTVVDKKLNQLQNKKALLQDYKKGVMQQIFPSAGSGQVQKLRFKIKNQVGELVEPPDWEEKKLGEIFDISAGGDIKKENVSKSMTDAFKYPIYANSEKKKGLYGFSNIYKIDYECVTITGRGSLGIANARFNKFYPIVRLLVLKPKFNLDVSYFENAINQLRIFSESTGVPQLTAPQISKYKVTFPTILEQTKIANFLSAIDTKINLLAEALEATKEFKKGLLQHMFV